MVPLLRPLPHGGAIDQWSNTPHHDKKRWFSADNPDCYDKESSELDTLRAERDDYKALLDAMSEVKACATTDQVIAAEMDAAVARAERDAAQQERDSIAKQLHAEVMSERERRVAAQEGITLKYVPELEAAQQENQTLRNEVAAVAHQLQWNAGRLDALLSSPRPQEPQP